MPASSRRYHSPRRAEQARRTRERILAEAGERFRGRGWAGTTLGDIATQAEVSLPSIELLFGTKAALLKAAIDVATAGDQEPVTMLDRPWADRARQAPDAIALLTIYSETLADAAARAAGLTVVAFEAAATSPELAEVAAALARQRETMAAWLVDGLAERGALRSGVTRQWAVDTVWALMDPALFLRLTQARGWDDRHYSEWFRDVVARLILP